MKKSQEDALANVEHASLGVGHAHDTLAATIRQAHKKGVSLRRIAEAASMSHEQVRRILAR